MQWKINAIPREARLINAVMMQERQRRSASTQDIDDEIVAVTTHSGRRTAGTIPVLPPSADDRRWMQLALHGVAISYSEHRFVANVDAQVDKQKKQDCSHGVRREQGTVRFKATILDLEISDSLFGMEVSMF